MNRRSFFAAIVAAPIATKLPQVIAAPARIAAKDTAVVQALIRGIPASELINRTLIQIGLLRPGQLASQHDAEYALGLLNEIVARLPGTARHGLGFLEFHSTIPLVYCLALRQILAAPLCHTYGLRLRGKS